MSAKNEQRIASLLDRYALPLIRAIRSKKINEFLENHHTIKHFGVEWTFRFMDSRPFISMSIEFRDDRYRVIVFVLEGGMASSEREYMVSEL